MRASATTSRMATSCQTRMTGIGVMVGLQRKVLSEGVSLLTRCMCHLAERSVAPIFRRAQEQVLLAARETLLRAKPPAERKGMRRRKPLHREVCRMARHKADVADDEFEIFASYHSTGDGRYIGGLKVIRKADRRILFPFDGAPQIGPYDSADEARRAAVEYGRSIVAADRAAPEP